MKETIMRRQWIFGVALAALLFVPALGFAHEGHAHKVMGTVSSVEGKNVMVKTTDGKSVMVMLDDKTMVTQGKAKVALSAVKVGERIVAEGPEQKEMIMATKVQLGAGASPSAATKGHDQSHADTHDRAHADSH